MKVPAYLRRPDGGSLCRRRSIRHAAPARSPHYSGTNGEMRLKKRREEGKEKKTSKGKRGATGRGEPSRIKQKSRSRVDPRNALSVPTEPFKKEVSRFEKKRKVGRERDEKESKMTCDLRGREKLAIEKARDTRPKLCFLLTKDP